MTGITSTKNISRFEPQEGNQFRGSFYVSAGEKCNIVGLQDGTFPDFGHHSPNEMGGVWTHPIKVLDGFWLGVNGKYDVATSYKTFPYGNLFTYELGDGIVIKRKQIAFDKQKGAVISYEIRNNSGEEKTLALDLVARFDLLPVWFSDECGIVDGADDAEFIKDDFIGGMVVAKDKNNDWYGAISCDFDVTSAVLITNDYIGGHVTHGQGVSTQINFSRSIAACGVTQFNLFVAGSYTSKTDVIAELAYIKQNHKQLVDEKVKRYCAIKEIANVKTSDSDFDTMFEWVKYNTDWLIQDCGEFGRALSAGIPEYLWWFGCDNSYSVQGLLAIGEFELARQTLLLVKNYSEKVNQNGKIVHEITTYGKVSNPGNTQETSHFITAVYHYLRYTNDVSTVRELYDYCKKGITWLLDVADDDKDLLPSGYGIIEIKGLNVELIDSAVYTCQALLFMHEMSVLFGEENVSYKENGQKLRDIINDYLWVEEQGLFADAVGTPRQIMERINVINQVTAISPEYKAHIDALMNKIKGLPQDEQIPFIINKNWVISTPMETMLASTNKAITALNNMQSESFVSEYGVRLDGFYSHNTMTISTGVQAVAEGRYGRTDASFALLKRMNKAFSMTLPGSINEMLPDYGCFSQAWTVYAVAVPTVECFAGFMPSAHQNKLTICPNIPTALTEFSINNVKIADSIINFAYANGEYCVDIDGDIEVTFIKNNVTTPLTQGKNVIKESI